MREKITKNMRTKSDDTLPVLTLPRLSSKLETLAEHVARFCNEFGIEPNESFITRVAAIAFANAILLGTNLPDAAKDLELMLAAESLPPDDEAEEFHNHFFLNFSETPNWAGSIQIILAGTFKRSADNTESLDAATAGRLRVLHGIRGGLIVARRLPELAARVIKLIEGVSLEQRFLAGRLTKWHDNEWSPYAAPFLEFAAAFYVEDSIEQRAICGAIHEVLPIARALDNPWDISFWAQTGWSGGRCLAHSYGDTCKALLLEAGKDEVENYVARYRRYVLGTARGDGEVQILKATLQFIGELESDGLARCYCTGREPRRLARVVFDFCYFAGIFSTIPVPVRAERSAT